MSSSGRRSPCSSDQRKLLRALVLESVIPLISGVDTIKVFDIIYALTGGGPNNSTVSISIHAFNQAFANANLSYAMAISVIAMLLTFVVFGIPFIRRNRARVAS